MSTAHGPPESGISGCRLVGFWGVGFGEQGVWVLLASDCGAPNSQGPLVLEGIGTLGIKASLHHDIKVS